MAIVKTENMLFLGGEGVKLVLLKIEQNIVAIKHKCYIKEQDISVNTR